MEKSLSKNPSFFRIYADFETDIEIDNYRTGKKTTIIFIQSPMWNRYFIVSEQNNVLESGYFESPLGYNIVDWFAHEAIKLESKMVFSLKNIRQDITRSEKDERPFGDNNICRYCEKATTVDKNRDQCPLTCKYRRPAHNKGRINILQKKSNFIPFGFHNFNN